MGSIISRIRALPICAGSSTPGTLIASINGISATTASGSAIEEISVGASSRSEAGGGTALLPTRKEPFSPLMIVVDSRATTLPVKVPVLAVVPAIDVLKISPA